MAFKGIDNQPDSGRLLIRILIRICLALSNRILINNSLNNIDSLISLTQRLETDTARLVQQLNYAIKDPDPSRIDPAFSIFALYTPACCLMAASWLA